VGARFLIHFFIRVCNPNSQTRINSFTGRTRKLISEANLEVCFEGFCLNQNGFDMDGGAVGCCVGAQYRYQDCPQDYKRGNLTKTVCFRYW